MKHRTIIHRMMVVVAIVTAVLIGCTPTPENTTQSNSLPPIYPDYADITIPCNIAPLNFVVRGEVEAVEAKVSCQGEELVVNAKGDAVCFDQDNWKALMQKATGNQVEVSVTALKNGRWTTYRSFGWNVVTDSIDSHLTYRLIEPDYEIYQNLTYQ